MNEDTGLEAFETTLDRAIRTMQDLESRLISGEDVSPEEVDAIARQAASGLQEALDVLSAMLGSEDEAPLARDDSVTEGQPSADWMSIIAEADVQRLRTGEASAL